MYSKIKFSSIKTLNIGLRERWAESPKLNLKILLFLHRVHNIKNKSDVFSLEYC